MARNPMDLFGAFNREASQDFIERNPFAEAHQRSIARVHIAPKPAITYTEERNPLDLFGDFGGGLLDVARLPEPTSTHWTNIFRSGFDALSGPYTPGLGTPTGIQPGDPFEDDDSALNLLREGNPAVGLEPIEEFASRFRRRPPQIDGGTIGAVLAALAAVAVGVYGRATAVPEEISRSVEAEPENPAVLERASKFIQSLWATKPEARAAIKAVAHRQRAAQSQGLNDIGAGGSTTGPTNLGEPFWTSTPRRVGTNVVVMGPSHRPAKHDFKGSTIKRSAQPMTGHHTMEFRM